MLKAELIEKGLSTVKREVESQYSHLREVIKQQIQAVSQKIELMDVSQKSGGNKGDLQALQRRLESIEDLFETQRKELFSTVTECDRAVNQRQEKIVKAIKEMCSEIKVEVPQILTK